MSKWHNYSTLQHVKFKAKGKVSSTLVIDLQLEIRIWGHPLVENGHFVTGSCD